MRRQVLLIILCIIMAGGLLGFLQWNRSQEKALSESLKKEAQSTEDLAGAGYISSASFSERSMTDAPASGSQDAQTSQGSQGDESVQTSSAAASSSSTTSDSSRNTAQTAFQAVSIRGDGFCEYGGTTADTSLAADLQKLLAEKGSSLTVQDYTMDMAGSLSQMRKAGVPESDISAYVEKHQQDADGATLQDTETIVRDLTADLLTRDDQADLPVIGMGYYGGFGGDVSELIEQEKKVLGTYIQQEDYIILGYYPEQFTEDSQKRDYDTAMIAAFGEHFVNVDAQVHTGDVTSAETREAIAGAICDKMTELGYVKAA